MGNGKFKIVKQAQGIKHLSMTMKIYMHCIYSPLTNIIKLSTIRIETACETRLQ